jgi:sodium transport system ATP-binding protein
MEEKRRETEDVEPGGAMDREARPEPLHGIEARGLTKVFQDRRRGDVRAAQDITFHCQRGEVFGLLGPNGAGKTTTLRMLSTVLRPTAGTARVGGFDINRDPLGVRRAIGFLSSTTGLYDRLTARETLTYFGRLHGLAPGALAERIDLLFEVFDMKAFADVRCEKLSTGMRQKVSIARTVVHDPPVLILDEPTLGLDILVAGALIRFIADCRAAGKCVLFSTHNMGEVERLCDRVGIIHDGRLRAAGTLDELRAMTSRHYLEEVFVRLMETP